MTEYLIIAIAATVLFLVLSALVWRMWQDDSPFEMDFERVAPTLDPIVTVKAPPVEFVIPEPIAVENKLHNADAYTYTVQRALTVGDERKTNVFVFSQTKPPHKSEAWYRESTVQAMLKEKDEIIARLTGS